MAVVAGTVFIGWKMLSSAFKLIMGSDKDKPEDKRKDRAWLLGPIAITFGLNARKGE